MMKTSAQENGTPWDVLQSNEAALNAMVRRAAALPHIAASPCWRGAAACL